MGPSADLSRSLDDDSMVDGPLISADALQSAIRREFQTVPTSKHAALLSVVHVWQTHNYSYGFDRVLYNVVSLIPHPANGETTFLSENKTWSRKMCFANT